MHNPNHAHFVNTLIEIQDLLQKPTEESTSTHDLLNALHTVLCSIEMLEMDITKQQQEVFKRLNIGAMHLEALLQSFLKTNGEVKNTIVARITAALPSQPN